MEVDAVFGLQVPQKCSKLPAKLLMPEKAWKDRDAFQQTASKLAQLFEQNFGNYREGTSPEVQAAGPHVPKPAKKRRKAIVG